MLFYFLSKLTLYIPHPPTCSVAAWSIKLWSPTWRRGICLSVGFIDWIVYVPISPDFICLDILLWIIVFDNYLAVHNFTGHSNVKELNYFWKTQIIIFGWKNIKNKFSSFWVIHKSYNDWPYSHTTLYDSIRQGLALLKQLINPFQP